MSYLHNLNMCHCIYQKCLKMLRVKYNNAYKFIIFSSNPLPLFFPLQEDHVIEKIGSFFGRPSDHNAEVVKQISIPLDSASTAEVSLQLYPAVIICAHVASQMLACKITQACENLLLHYNSLSSTSQHQKILYTAFYGIIFTGK